MFRMHTVDRPVPLPEDPHSGRPSVLVCVSDCILLRITSRLVGWDSFACKPSLGSFCWESPPGLLDGIPFLCTLFIQIFCWHWLYAFLPLCIYKDVSISLYLFVLLLLQVAIFSGWVRLFECLRNEHIMCIIRIISIILISFCITGVLGRDFSLLVPVQAG